jgi:hypothetical protein
MISSMLKIIFSVSDKSAVLHKRIVIIIPFSIIDLDGLGNCQQGGQLLSDCQRLERAATHVDTSPEIDAGESVWA